MSNSLQILPSSSEKILFKILYEIALAHGESFFDTVVESISKNLDVKYVLIGEYLSDSYKIRAKSLWAGDSLVKEYEYSVVHTPCEHVFLDKGVKAYLEGIQTKFPKDLDLVEWELESYIGIPLFNDKKMVIGHLAVLDTKPMENLELVQTIMNVCSSRIESELNRAISDEIAKKREEENNLKTQELIQSVSLLEAIIESTADGLLIADGKGKMVRFNKQFLKMWKMPSGMAFRENEAVGVDIAIAQLKNPEQFISKIKEVYENPDAVSFDILHFKDGRVFERDSHPQKVGEEIVGRVWSFRDVTQKAKIEEELRQSESMFRNLFEESPIGIVISNYSSFVLDHVNKKFSRMLQYSFDELKSMTAFDITHPEDMDKHVKSFQDVDMQNNADSSFEKRYITKNGEVIWGHVSASAVRDKKGNLQYRVLMIQDITDKKNALLEIEQKAKELNEKNQELQKYIDSNMQLENFAYIASHDLREPLLTIMGLVEILKESYAEQLDEEASAFLLFIEKCAKNMELLINDLLTYSLVDTQEHTVTHFNLKELLQKVMNGLQKNIEEQKASIEFVNIPQGFIGNETKILQLFQNLIANAIKFKKEDKDPIIKISANDKGHYWEFSVSDNGIGIAPNHQEKIFLLFKKLHSKSKYAGTGIGLATCKKIVEQHGGKIWLESELGKGTIFHFTVCKGEKNQCK